MGSESVGWAVRHQVLLPFKLTAMDIDKGGLGCLNPPEQSCGKKGSFALILIRSVIVNGQKQGKLLC